ncbi:MAG: DUF1566 domain-containing protein [Pseudomonadota bacterium]
MKRFLGLLAVIFITSTGQVFAQEGIKIGDEYQGGIVAYILQSGDPYYDKDVQHGLIATLSDQSSGIRWDNGDYKVTGATGEALGTGLWNTKKIIETQGDGAYAAKLCSDLGSKGHESGSGGFDDWWLPSKDELNKLYVSKDDVGGFMTKYNEVKNETPQYWSSSESVNDFARHQDFSNGGQFGSFETEHFRVRCVRAF